MASVRMCEVHLKDFDLQRTPRPVVRWLCEVRGSARLCEALRTRGPRGVQEHQPGGEALSGRQCGPPGPQRHERAQRASTGFRMFFGGSLSSVCFVWKRNCWIPPRMAVQTMNFVMVSERHCVLFAWVMLTYMLSFD